MFADLVVHSHFKLATRFICISNYCQGLSSLAHSGSPQGPVVTSRFQDRWEAPCPTPSTGQVRAKLQWRQSNLAIVLLFWQALPWLAFKTKISGSLCALELPYLLVFYLNCVTFLSNPKIHSRRIWIYAYKTKVFHLLDGTMNQAVHTSCTSLTCRLRGEQHRHYSGCVHCTVPRAQ